MMFQKFDCILLCVQRMEDNTEKLANSDTYIQIDLVTSCLYLSVKLHSSQQSFSINQILKSCDSSFNASNIREIQSQLLNLLDFQPYFQTPLQQLCFPDQDDQNSKILFLSQVLMFNDFEPIFNRLYLDDMRQICASPGVMNNTKSEVLKILKNKKQTYCLIKKYISKFDVQEFIQQLAVQ